MSEMNFVGKDALHPLEKALHDPDGAVRFEAALALARYRQDGAAAVGVLTESLREKDLRKRDAARKALQAIEGAKRGSLL